MSIPLQELLDGAAAGDAEAERRLLREIYPQVAGQVHRALERDFRRKHRWMLPLFSTNDIVQDVFVGVVQSVPRVGDRDDAQLIAWLSTAVKNRIIDRLRFHLAHRRDARQEQRIESEDAWDRVPGDAPTPSSIAAVDERMRLIGEVLAELSDADRELWRLRVEDERGFAEIAAATEHLSTESARSAFRRLQAKLALRLHKLGVRAPDGEAAP